MFILKIANLYQPASTLSDMHLNRMELHHLDSTSDTYHNVVLNSGDCSTRRIAAQNMDSGPLGTTPVVANTKYPRES
jgi:hypothetical protein